MLVIISDLHLTDGTSGPTLPPGAFQVFTEQLQDLALRASWRSDHRYRPIERIDLVLLGDILDVTNSARWLAGSTRPWTPAEHPQQIETISGIVGDILDHNAEALKILRAMAVEGTIRLPLASLSGEPVFGAEGQPVPVRIHYMVGGRDWYFHLPQSDYDAVRRQVAQHMGLATRFDQPFPHEPGGSEELLDVLRGHRVFCRHGEIFDPIHFPEDRCAASVGDALAVELIARFNGEIQERLADQLTPTALWNLGEIHHVQPLLLAPVFIEGVLERHCPGSATRTEIKRLWDRLVDDVLSLELVGQQDRWRQFNLTDGLEQSLKFSKRISKGWPARTRQWLQELRGVTSESYCQHALTESEFRNRRARHVVYGHTHQVELTPLEASYADGYVLSQVYYNTGTWRRVYRQTMSAFVEHEFIPTDAVSFHAFFQGDERHGRPSESWTGMLGVNLAEAAQQGTTRETADRRQALPPQFNGHAAVAAR